ncbi:hypothetical protein ACOSQ3_010137 [Xanthoceras sorbifolium]
MYRSSPSPSPFISLAVAVHPCPKKSTSLSPKGSCYCYRTPVHSFTYRRSSRRVRSDFFDGWRSRFYCTKETG